MTAYKLTPVGANGVERHREQRIEFLSCAELLAENARLREAWKAAHDARIVADVRANRASRVLASLGRLSPRMADLVEAGRREIWRLDQ